MICLSKILMKTCHISPVRVRYLLRAESMYSLFTIAISYICNIYYKEPCNKEVPHEHLNYVIWSYEMQWGIIYRHWNLEWYSFSDHTVCCCSGNIGCRNICMQFLIARFMEPAWGPLGADRTQVGPMLAPWSLLSGVANEWVKWGYVGEISWINGQ